MSRENWPNPDDSEEVVDPFSRAREKWRERVNIKRIQQSASQWKKWKDQIELLERELFEFPIGELELEQFFEQVGERVYIITPKESANLIGFIFVQKQITRKADGGRKSIAIIDNFAISPELQNQELGLYMLAELLEILQAEGVSQVQAPVRESNMHMIKLLRKAGFVATGMQDDLWREEDRELTDDQAIWFARLVPRSKGNRFQ